MKTKLMGWIRTARRILTEVPGWPDAPLSMQLRRAMPVLIPCGAMVLILDWHLLVHAPRAREQSRALQPLLALQTEVETLRINCAEPRVAEFADRAAAASRLLLPSPRALPEFLATLKQDAALKGWDAQFVAADPGAMVPGADDVVGYLPFRGKLVPLATNPSVYASFLDLLERYSGSERRIDLVRLSVRADEQRWQRVEMNFRVAYPVNR